MTDFQDLFLNVGNNQMLHASKGGSGDLVLIAVHGASREYQNVNHWKAHLGKFATLGRVLLVDMLGHGSSTPGSATQIPAALPKDRQVEAIVALLKAEAVIPAQNKRIVLIGRSYGGAVVTALLQHPEVAPAVKGLVYIAPAFDFSKLPQGDSSLLPALLVWAKEDGLISSKPNVQAFFKNTTELIFDKVLAPGQETHWAHSPENIKTGEFQAALSDFVSKL